MREVDGDFFQSLKHKPYRLRDRCSECFAPMSARALRCKYCSFERSADEARMAQYEAHDRQQAARARARRGGQRMRCRECQKQLGRRYSSNLCGRCERDLAPIPEPPEDEVDANVEDVESEG